VYETVTIYLLRLPARAALINSIMYNILYLMYNILYYDVNVYILYEISVVRSGCVRVVLSRVTGLTCFFTPLLYVVFAGSFYFS